MITKAPLRPGEYNHDDEEIRVFQSADQQSLIQSFHLNGLNFQHTSHFETANLSKGMA